MAICPLCNKDMMDTDACAERRLVFGDNTQGDIERHGDEDDVVKPIPYGQESHTESYDEVMERYNDEIEDGGRGRLTADDIREERASFVDRYPDAASYQQRTCHDCGVRVGEYHHPGCDMEECPNPACDEHQLFICDCQPHVLTRANGA